MVSEAVELAEIELRRRNVRLDRYVAARLPMLHGRPDPDRTGADQSAEERGRIDRHGASGPRHCATSNCACCQGIVDERQTWSSSRCSTPASGLAPEVMDRLYEAFYSTKSRWHGYRPEPVPLDRRVAPGQDACREHLQWRRSVRAADLHSGFPCWKRCALLLDGLRDSCLCLLDPRRRRDQRARCPAGWRRRRRAARGPPPCGALSHRGGRRRQAGRRPRHGGARRPGRDAGVARRARRPALLGAIGAERAARRPTARCADSRSCCAT